MRTLTINNPLLPYTREELEVGMMELGKTINKQYIYLKGQCRTKPCSVNLSRYNMCYGIEKTYRRIQKECGTEKQDISNETIFNIIKKSVAEQGPRIVEKYNLNETKHLERIKKERQLRLKQAKINYRHMFAPENNIPKPKPLLIKLETVDDLELGANETSFVIKQDDVESESFSQNVSVEATVQTIANINEFNSVPSIELMDLEPELLNDPIYKNLIKSIEEGTTIPLNYDAFRSGVVTSTQKDVNGDTMRNTISDTLKGSTDSNNLADEIKLETQYNSIESTFPFIYNADMVTSTQKESVEYSKSNTSAALNSQLLSHEGIPLTEEFSAGESYSFGTESILNELKRKRLSSDKNLASQIIEEIKSDI